MCNENEEVNNFRIAGDLTCAHWVERKAELEKGGNPGLWNKAFDDFLMGRLKTRYLDPIETLQICFDSKGEGFSIVTIQCAVIEFLAALRLGKNYRYISKADQKNKIRCGKYEYSHSQNIFVDFLKREEPFKSLFKGPGDARSFYTNVRCGLLHEAGTKGGWNILATSGDVIDRIPKDVVIGLTGKTVFRDELQAGIEAYLIEYGLLLKGEGNPEIKKVQEAREAFIRKFDHLAKG